MEHEPLTIQRSKALASVKQTMTQAEKNLAEHAVSGDEFDAAVDEAMEDVRRRAP